MNWRIRNKHVFITGATSGFGVVVAKELFKRGARITIASRDLDKGGRVKQVIEQGDQGESGTIRLIHCDLASMGSIREACADYKRVHGTLDVLINNAGIWNPLRRETVDGIEEVLAVNLLAPLLTIELMRPLLGSAGVARVINTTSGLHQGKINFDDLEYTTGYTGLKAYRQSKLGVILMTRWLSREQGGESITHNCVHPGLISTDLARNCSVPIRTMFRLIGGSTERGAQTILHLATGEAAGKITGEYWHDKKTDPTTSESRDLEAAERLRECTMHYLKPHLGVETA